MSFDEPAFEPLPRPPKPAPVSDTARIHALDVARGFALLGIFLVNIQSFSQPLGTFVEQKPPEGSGIAGQVVFYLVKILCESKFTRSFRCSSASASRCNSCALKRRIGISQAWRCATRRALSHRSDSRPSAVVWRRAGPVLDGWAGAVAYDPLPRTHLGHYGQHPLPHRHPRDCRAGLINVPGCGRRPTTDY